MNRDMMYDIMRMLLYKFSRLDRFVFFIKIIFRCKNIILVEIYKTITYFWYVFTQSIQAGSMPGNKGHGHPTWVLVAIGAYKPIYDFKYFNYL